MASTGPSKHALESQADLDDLASLVRMGCELARGHLSQVLSTIDKAVGPDRGEREVIEMYQARIARMERGLRTLGRVHVHDVDGQLTLF